MPPPTFHMVATHQPDERQFGCLVAASAHSRHQLRPSLDAKRVSHRKRGQSLSKSDRLVIQVSIQFLKILFRWPEEFILRQAVFWNGTRHCVERAEVEVCGLCSKPDRLWNGNNVAICIFLKGEAQHPLVKGPMELFAEANAIFQGIEVEPAPRQDVRSINTGGDRCLGAGKVLAGKEASEIISRPHFAPKVGCRLSTGSGKPPMARAFNPGLRGCDVNVLSKLSIVGFCGYPTGGNSLKTFDPELLFKQRQHVPIRLTQGAMQCAGRIDQHALRRRRRRESG